MSDRQVGRDRRDRYIGNRHINRKRDRQIDKKTDRQIDRKADIQIDRQIT